MEILFYHLEQKPLEQVLPLLLEKTLERGWQGIVEVGSAQRAADLDSALWSWRDDSFLPHGIAGSEADHLQPILLVTDESNGNAAQVRFFVDGALPRPSEEYERLVFLFDGHNPEALENARGAWKILNKDHACTYWQQGADGRWMKKA